MNGVHWLLCIYKYEMKTIKEIPLFVLNNTRYDKVTNTLLIRRFNNFGKDRGWFKYKLSVNKKGYPVVCINNKVYSVHRIVYAAYFKKTKFGIIDHIDSNKLNYYVDNLREITNSKNILKAGLRANNKSGHTGVYFCPKLRTWEAYITINQKKIKLGRYKLKEDAVKARSFAEVTYS